MFNFNEIGTPEYIDGYDHGFIDGAVIIGTMVAGACIGALIAKGIKEGFYSKDKESK